MSGSPPPKPPSDPPQIAGRRRKRSETPPTTTAPQTTSPETQVGVSTAGAVARARAGQLGVDVHLPAGPYSTSYPPQLPQGSYGAGSSSMGAITASPFETRFPAGPVSPRTTRKTKAHVASACVNCKKKHLRCDQTRPCHRCIQCGKEDSCVDVEHKKRGRPPLRPDEPSSRRSYDSSAALLSGQPLDPARRMPTADPSGFGPGFGYVRPPFRPLQPTYDSRPQWRPGQPYQPYSAPTISPSAATAMGTFAPASRAYPGQMAISQAPYMQPPYGSSYGYFPGQEVGYPESQYANPIFPRSQLPHPQAEAAMGMQVSSSLQLPPIRPAPERSPIDPALAQQRPSSSGSRDMRRPDSKRPRMDIQGILGPKHD